MSGTKETTLRDVAPGSRREARVSLVFYFREGAEIVVPGPQPLVVGRSFPADIVVDDPSVSRTHARFFVAPDGGVVFEDLGSTNGTRLNGAPTPRGRIAPGDEVRVGDVSVALHVLSTVAGVQGLLGYDLFLRLLDDELVRARTFARPISLLMVGARAPGHPYRDGARPGLSAAAPASGAGVVASLKMRAVWDMIDRVAPSILPVLVQGETGTGKEVVARALHARSNRKDAPLRSVNCAAIPANLLETHRDLEKMCAENAFRWDLYYRLHGVTIALPALRERTEETRPLAESFLRDACRDNGRSVRAIDDAAMAALTSWHWPGNVRELKNVVQRAVVIARSDVVTVEDLPERMRAAAPADGRGSLPGTSVPARGPGQAPGVPGRAPEDPNLDYKERLRLEMQRYETNLIVDALGRAGGNVTAAAQALKIPVRTLTHRMQALGIKKRSDPA